MADETVQAVHDPRIEVRLRARISTIDPEIDPSTGKQFFRTSEETCANVSRGGAFVSMRDVIPPGRRLLVELEIPGGRAVQAIGRVAWARYSAATSESPTDAPAGSPLTSLDSGIGIQIVSWRRDEMLVLEQFVARSFRRRARKPEPDASWTTIDR